jgi:hypothetical protein
MFDIIIAGCSWLVSVFAMSVLLEDYLNQVTYTSDKEKKMQRIRLLIFEESLRNFNDFLYDKEFQHEISMEQVRTAYSVHIDTVDFASTFDEGRYLLQSLDRACIRVALYNQEISNEALFSEMIQRLSDPEKKQQLLEIAKASGIST